MIDNTEEVHTRAKEDVEAKVVSSERKKLDELHNIIIITPTDG